MNKRGKAAAAGKRSCFPLRKRLASAVGERRCQEATQIELMDNKGRTRRASLSPAPEYSVPRRAALKRPRRKELACHLTGNRAGVHRQIKRAVQRKLTNSISVNRKM